MTQEQFDKQYTNWLSQFKTKAEVRSAMQELRLQAHKAKENIKISSEDKFSIILECATKTWYALEELNDNPRNLE